MAKTKIPDYDSMDFEALSAESGRRFERMQEIALQITDDMPAAERLTLELERAEHRAHLNVIQPKRARIMVREQKLADPELHRMAGMSDEEFEAFLEERRALRQEITITDQPEGSVSEPGVN